MNAIPATLARRSVVCWKSDYNECMKIIFYLGKEKNGIEGIEKENENGRFRF
jgi:hypothetical protein